MIKSINSIFSRINLFIRSLMIIAETVYYSIGIIGLMAIMKDKTIFFKLSKIWAKNLLRIVNIKIEIIGSENLNKDETYVYVMNHSSLFDIPILLTSLNDNIRMIYKKELEKIPIFGYCLKKSPFIEIVRSEGRNAMASLDQAVNSVREGVSVALFPEGSRSLDGILKPFKRGAFILASRSQKPIVPISIIGSDSILPAGSLKIQKSTKIKFIIHKPLPNSLYNTKEEEKELIENVRNMIIFGMEHQKQFD